ncbi:MAG: apolipoprotein N-acyltransferase [Treponema sp.]|nr:apolipoprotein N-acyltransferase [Treponema sp.]
MKLILQVFYTLFSSLLLSLAIPNELLTFGSPFLAFAALIPYYLAVKESKNFGRAYLLGFLHAGTTHLISSFWLAYFKDFAALTLGASAFGTAMWGSFFGALLYLPYFTEKSRNKLNMTSLSCRHSVPFRIFWFASVYTAYEWYKSTGFLGYPWGTLSSCMFRARIFMQLAAITGTYGITFLTAFFAGLIGEGFWLYYKVPECRAKKRLVSSYVTAVQVWAILFALTMVYGLFQYTVKRTPIKKLTTILVQQNQDPWLEESDRESILKSQELTNERISELSEKGEKADLIVWSEGCLKTSYPDAKNHYERYPKVNPLIDFVKENGVPFLAGGSYIRRYPGSGEDYDIYNAALVFDKNGNLRGWYGKNHLVPMAEAIPFMEYKPVKTFMAKVIGISAGWSPGNQYTLFEIPCQWYDRPQIETTKTINLNQDYIDQKVEENLPPVTKISTPICYDDAFTDIMRPLWKNGSEVFMNITDDSWSLKNSSEIQHFVIASYRAIEYRTTLVRSTNAGLSAVLDPAGRVLEELPLFQASSTVYDIPVYKRKTTTYAFLGNWLPFVLNTFILLVLFGEILCFETREYVFPERKLKNSKKSAKAKKSHKEEKKSSKNKKKDSKKKSRKVSEKSDKKKSDKKKKSEKSDTKKKKKSSKK